MKKIYYLGIRTCDWLTFKKISVAPRLVRRGAMKLGIVLAGRVESLEGRND